MGSGRLPGKVLADLGGRPMVDVILRRLRPARLVDRWVVATSDRPADDPVADLAGRLGVGCFRGSEEDVLDRYYQAARTAEAKTVVRLTGDNPFVDARFVDAVVGEFTRGECDYLAPAPRSFPIGLSAEVFTFAALTAAWAEDGDPRTREHVTPFIYGHPNRFHVRRMEASRNDSALRLTVDTAEDLDLARRVFNHFGRDAFGWEEAVAVIRERPEWAQLNQGVRQRTV
jgi:spore coat polysaccharide biosynthesis protein SpsF (cytidylyltransferase family)